MKITASALATLALLIPLSACGGGEVTEEEFIAEMKTYGYSDRLADCMIDEIEDSSGSVDEFLSLDASEQESRAFDAGMECGGSADPEELDDILGKLDIDLSDPELRDPLLSELKAQGMPADLATCIVEEAIAQDLAISDFDNEQLMTPIFEKCDG